jgi:hypothetical protein
MFSKDNAYGVETVIHGRKLNFKNMIIKHTIDNL